MTTPPPAAPTPEEAKAVEDARLNSDLRDLAQQIAKSSDLGFEPSTLIKGTVKAFDFTGSPPTLTLNLGGDTTTEISNVRTMNNYSPQVGHTVLVAKQGAQIVVLGHVAELSAYTVQGGAGGWVRATLTSGEHGGGDEGSVYYRRILDHGSWKMQWRGGLDVAGTVVIDTADALLEEYRPSSKRTILAARETTGANAAQIIFQPDGRVELAGLNTTAASSTVSGDISSEDPIDTTTSVDIGTTGATNPGSTTVADMGATGNTNPGSTTSVDPGVTGATNPGSTTSVDPNDVTTTVGLSTSTVDPLDTTTSVALTTDSVDPIDTTGAASAGTAHTHGVTGSHSHDIGAHSHGVTGSHWHDIADHWHGVTGAHSHAMAGTHTHDLGSHSHGMAASHGHSLPTHSHAMAATHTHDIDPHSHGVTGAHDHTFSGGSHSHSVTTPTWVSFNGVEYFL